MAIEWSVAQAAEALGVSKSLVRLAADQGRLACRRNSRDHRVFDPEVIRLAHGTLKRSGGSKNRSKPRGPTKVTSLVEAPNAAPTRATIGASKTTALEPDFRPTLGGVSEGSFEGAAKSPPNRLQAAGLLEADPEALALLREIQISELSAKVLRAEAIQVRARREFLVEERELVAAMRRRQCEAFLEEHVPQDERAPFYESAIRGLFSRLPNDIVLLDDALFTSWLPEVAAEAEQAHDAYDALTKRRDRIAWYVNGVRQHLVECHWAHDAVIHGVGVAQSFLESLNDWVLVGQVWTSWAALSAALQPLGGPELLLPIVSTPWGPQPAWQGV